MSRYPDFFRNLLSSPSKEVRMLAKMVSSDPRSNTCKNLRYLRELTNFEQGEQYSSWCIRESLPVKKVPKNEMWRLGLLTTDGTQTGQVPDSKHICAMLCYAKEYFLRNT